MERRDFLGAALGCAALDPELVGEVLIVIRDLAREGMTMIIVTHEIPFACDVADRIVFVDNGRS